MTVYGCFAPTWPAPLPSPHRPALPARWGLKPNGLNEQLDDKLGFEAYYNFAVTPWLQISADVQYIEQGIKTSDKAWVKSGCSPQTAPPVARPLTQIMPRYLQGWHGGIVTMLRSSPQRIVGGMSRLRMKPRNGSGGFGLTRTRSIRMSGGRVSVRHQESF